VYNKIPSADWFYEASTNHLPLKVECSSLGIYLLA
jgi:hypothetical protein